MNLGAECKLPTEARRVGSGLGRREGGAVAACMHACSSMDRQTDRRAAWGHRVPCRKGTSGDGDVEGQAEGNSRQGGGERKRRGGGTRWQRGAQKAWVRGQGLEKQGTLEKAGGRCGVCPLVPIHTIGKHFTCALYVSK